ALYTDLMVNRGEIPSYGNLLPRDQVLFEQRIEVPEDADERKTRFQHVREELSALGVAEPYLKVATTTTPDKLSPRDQELRKELLWYAELVPFLRSTIGADAADLLRGRLHEGIQTYGIDVALKRDQKDYGVLSLVARTRNSWVQGPLVRTLAAWNPWMW